MPADVSALRKLADDLRKAAADAPKKAGIAVRKTCFDIQALAQIIVPVDTGTLKNSIGVEMADDNLSGKIGPTANYGAYVEFGTSKMAAQPYMNPAADKKIPKLVKALETLGRLK